MHLLSLFNCQGAKSRFNGVILGVVAAIEERKGHRVLLHALELLKCDGHFNSASLTALFVGEGPLTEEMRAYVHERGLDDMVRFVGVENNIVHCMRIMDMLVLPSLKNEDFPYVVIEAMACGKPVIASAVAGTPEQITNGTTGILVPPGDPGALSDAILQLAGDPGLRERMGKRAAEAFASHFTAEQAVARYLNLYESLLDS